MRIPRPPYVVDCSTPEAIKAAVGREWLLTTGNGGFAMGTPVSVNRRKYHALLNASARPPVERLCLLNSLDEEVVVGGGQPAWLATHRWAGSGYEMNNLSHLRRFEKDAAACRWVYEVGGVQIVKELRMGWKRNSCAVRYTVKAAGGGTRPGMRLRVYPMVTIRDFHGTLPGVDQARYMLATIKRTFRVSAEGHSLTLTADKGSATQEPSVRANIRYELETERDQADMEDLFSPGFFEVIVPEEPGEFRFTIGAALDPESADPARFDDPARGVHLAAVSAGMARAAGAGGGAEGAALAPLAIAADDFLVTRRVGGAELMTVIAGYPWFSDWGRDTMISLVGLMLTSGRLADALGCLRTFAAHVDRGMIPNRFDDYGGPPEYNTIDASLWFLHACHQYVRSGGAQKEFDALLKPACLQIIDHYIAGTRDGIRVDPADGLVMGGDATTQLTWMDAKREGVVFTPRHGKAVEISALWHHGLLCIASLIEPADRARAAQLKDMAKKTGESIRTLFWNQMEQRLHDCLQLKDGTWRPMPEVRPNQLFAVSLEHSALTSEQQKAVVACCAKELLTPMGLRTLSPKDPNYRPKFEGDMMSRDGAYHNGTVWPWLIGPYAEAVLRAGGFSAEAKERVRREIAPLLAALNGDSVGQLFEVYDGEPTNGRQLPGGCMAQAWSVGELLRVAAMV